MLHQHSTAGKASLIINAKIKAAKRIRKKAVFCVDNVSTDCSVDDICSFVSGMSVKVLKSSRSNVGMEEPSQVRTTGKCSFQQQNR